MATLENVPLDSSTSATSEHQVLKSYWSGSVPCTRIKIGCTIILLVVLLIVVIVLAALLGAAHRSKNQQDTVKVIHPTNLFPRPTTAGPEAWWQIRLPRDIVPVHYNVFLNVTPDLPRFDGNVEIVVNVTSSTDLILVHISGLNISHVTLVNQVKLEDPLVIKTQFEFKKNDFYVIQSQAPLYPGPYVVKMYFVGFFSPDLRGLYRSSYKKYPGGKLSNFAATQFEPVRGRRAFPCMDEPALKATFNITIAHRPEYIALSNMPIYRSEIKNGQTHDYFLKTVVMPTYLVALVVGEFEFLQTVTKNGVEMKTYSRPSVVNYTSFALQDGSKIMTFFEEYFNINYSLSKADMIAVPDFGPGAMENWGLITYRESYIVWENSISSEYNKISAASIIAHELAHQWFGNIVTMKWWDDLWLNEGFADFMSYIGTDAAHPSWKLNERFIGKTMHPTMLLDGLVSSHPIKVDVNGPSEIFEIFDSISYGKGSSILRMLESFLGKDIFRTGLTRYIKKHAFSNAETDDLWRALEQESCSRSSCVKVKHVMDTWTLQMGYPVITLTKHNATAYRLSQKHFLLDKTANISSSKYKSPFNYTWVVPFTFVSSNNKNKDVHWMDKTSISISDNSAWIKGNRGHSGYYLVNYDVSNWEALNDQLNRNHTVLDAIERAGLIFDAFTLARGGELGYAIALNMTTYLNKEDKLEPWTVLLKKTYNLGNLLSQSSPIYQRLQKYLVHQGKSLYNKLGFSSSGTHIEIFLRRQLLNLFCSTGEPACITNAKQRFNQWMTDPSKKVHPNLRAIVLQYGLAYGGVEEWDFVYEQYKTTEMPDERIDMIKAMAATKEPWLLSRYLEYVLDQSKFPQNQIRSVFAYVADNTIGNRVAWDFIRINWSKLKKKFGSEQFVFYRMVPAIAKYFTNDYELKELLELSNAVVKRTGIESAKVQQTIDGVKANIQWYKNNADSIDEWLTEYSRDNNIH